MRPLHFPFLRRTRAAVRDHIVAPIEQEAASRIIALTALALLAILFLAGTLKRGA